MNGKSKQIAKIVIQDATMHLEVNAEPTLLATGLAELSRNLDDEQFNVLCIALRAMWRKKSTLKIN